MSQDWSMPMDPNATLMELLKLAEEIQADDADETNIDMLRVAELVDALDGWMSTGGFLPDRWKR